MNSSGKEIDPIFSPKMQNKDRILVYKQGNKTISFFGDLHPSYSGSVVKAMASAKNGYPIISQLLSGVNSFVSVIPVCDVVGQKKMRGQVLKTWLIKNYLIESKSNSLQRL